MRRRRRRQRGVVVQVVQLRPPRRLHRCQRPARAACAAAAAAAPRVVDHWRGRHEHASVGRRAGVPARRCNVDCQAQPAGAGAAVPHGRRRRGRPSSTCGACSCCSCCGRGGRRRGRYPAARRHGCGAGGRAGDGAIVVAAPVARRPARAGSPLRRRRHGPLLLAAAVRLVHQGGEWVPRRAIPAAAHAGAHWRHCGGRGCASRCCSGHRACPSTW